MERLQKEADPATAERKPPTSAQKEKIAEGGRRRRGALAELSILFSDP
jgi:hypothetical protein